MENPFEVIGSRLSNIESLLIDIKHKSPGRDESFDDRELLTVPQAAKYLSLEVSTIYSLTSKGDLPAMKRGRRCYFAKADLFEYLKTGRRKTNAEIKADADKYISKSKKPGL